MTTFETIIQIQKTTKSKSVQISSNLRIILQLKKYPLSSQFYCCCPGWPPPPSLVPEYSYAASWPPDLIPGDQCSIKCNNTEQLTEHERLEWALYHFEVNTGHISTYFMLVLTISSDQTTTDGDGWGVDKCAFCSLIWLNGLLWTTVANIPRFC